MNTVDITILVVDDNRANLKVIQSLLAQAGYRVRVANSGRMALASVKASRPHLILLDIRMPDMDGYEVCERLKVDDAIGNIPIIFFSAAGEPTDRAKAFSAGGVGYLTKPLHAEEVLKCVRTHLATTAKQDKHQRVGVE